MTHLPVDNQCPVLRSCTWSQHGRKHFPFRGMLKEHTVRQPARYRSGLSAEDIRLLEQRTVREGQRDQRSETKSEYLRPLQEVIGWDRGENASISFVECSGGLSAGRAFHGRPMSDANRRVPRP